MLRRATTKNNHKKTQTKGLIRPLRDNYIGEEMKGSCLCGTVEYEIDQLDMSISHCHCDTCRKAHSAAYATNVGVMREHFRWAKGKEKLAAFESSPGKLRHFCSDNNTQHKTKHQTQPQIIVRVATLDEDPGSKPVMHIWC